MDRDRWTCFLFYFLFVMYIDRRTIVLCAISLFFFIIHVLSVAVGRIVVTSREPDRARASRTRMRHPKRSVGTGRRKKKGGAPTARARRRARSRSVKSDLDVASRRVGRSVRWEVATWRGGVSVSVVASVVGGVIHSRACDGDDVTT